MGYIFKDLVGLFVLELIEKLGLKGIGIGGVEVSEMDGNYFVVYEGVVSDDVMWFIDLVKM